MIKTKWYQKPVYLLVALALVMSLGIMAVPMAGVVEASSITWTEYAGNPVFAGTNRAYYPCVLAIDGIYHMWYTDKDGGGYQVGYTTSADGVNWSSPPTIVTGLTGQPNHVVVVNIGTETSPHYRIWYADAAVWPYNVDLLKTAESANGIDWGNDQAIGQTNNLIRENDSSHPAYRWLYGSYGPGAVLYNPSGYDSLNEADPMGNKYVMYYDEYTRYGSTAVNEVTMLAISVDGINWTRYADAPVLHATGGSTAWDAQYAYAWTVLKLSDGYHMWYSGGILDSNDGIGYAYSADGLTWTKEPNPVLHANDIGVPGWRQERTYTPSVIKEGNTYKMWFSGVGSGYSIGYATGSPPPSEVWVDDGWTGYCYGDPADGHIFGYDAFATIQDGIDAVAGSTVHVLAGTYEEEITIDENLTLLGAQADVPIIEGERAGDESIIRGKGTGSYGYSWCVVRVKHSDVVINGFTIENGQRDIAIQGGLSGHEGISNILISYNYVENTGIKGSNSGIFRDNAVADVTITHNYIASNPNGIKTNGGATTITDNTFYGNGKGIDFHGGDPYDKYFPDYTEPKYPTIISGNAFTNDSTSIALRLDKCHQSIEITGNDITEARSVAIKTWNVYSEDLVNPAIHYNNICNNEFGVNNQVADINLNATLNWWGDASGPEDTSGDTDCKTPSEGGWNCDTCDKNDGTGNAVTDNVDYCPWLEALPMSKFVIDHAKIDFKKKADDDKVRVSGKLELDTVCGNDVDISEDVIVKVGPLTETITMAEKGKKGEKWEYKRPKGGEGDIKHMTIDWKNGKFDIRMDKADLSELELTDPNNVTISVQIGDDLGEETITMREKKHHWDYKAK